MKNPIERQDERARRLSEIFTTEQMQGPRWNLAGWAEANQALDAEGLEVFPDIRLICKPEPPKNG